MISTTEKVDINKLNAEILTEPERLIAHEEKKFEDKLFEICDRLQKEKKNFILLTGPSSSGKTTTSKMMVEILKNMGKSANRISLDNFYKDRDDLPKWEDGRKDYESIEGLDLSYLAQLFASLEKNGRADFPVFAFQNGKRSEKTFEVTFDSETFLIFEGIHALNPKLTDILNIDKCFKLYISVNTDFVDDKGEVILQSRDLRLIRRLLRDEVVRATPPDFIFALWDEVCLGEDKYINLYRDNADVHLNSTHLFEPMLYKTPLKEMLKKYNIPPEYKPMKECVLNAVNSFETLDKSLIPQTSLVREFIQLL
ncbi:MAG: hypothetical protein Q8876_04720 [Bacillota bacterium]|nr:hypothetical protein [Bacillota bacterium]